MRPRKADLSESLILELFSQVLAKTAHLVHQYPDKSLAQTHIRGRHAEAKMASPIPKGASLLFFAVSPGFLEGGVVRLRMVRSMAHAGAATECRLYTKHGAPSLIYGPEVKEGNLWLTTPMLSSPAREMYTSTTAIGKCRLDTALPPRLSSGSSYWLGEF